MIMERILLLLFPFFVSAQVCNPGPNPCENTAYVNFRNAITNITLTNSTCGPYGRCGPFANTLISPPDGVENEITCTCTMGFTGYLCETDPCSGFCKNNGTCRIQGATQRCDCPTGTFGIDCSLNTNNGTSNNGEWNPLINNFLYIWSQQQEQSTNRIGQSAKKDHLCFGTQDDCSGDKSLKVSVVTFDAGLTSDERPSTLYFSVDTSDSSISPFQEKLVGNKKRPSTVFPNAKMAFGDMDKDGDFDALISTEDGSLKWCQNIGSKSSPYFMGTANCQSIESNMTKAGTLAFGDVNFDDNIDFVVGSPTGEMRFYLGNSVGGWDLSSTVKLIEGPVSPAIITNEDDKSVILLVGSHHDDGSILWYDFSPSQSGATNGTLNITNPTCYGTKTLEIVDIDRDGADDLLVGCGNSSLVNDTKYYRQTSYTNHTSNSRTLRLWELASQSNNPTVRKKVWQGYGGIANGYSDLATVDIDGDGDKDLFQVLASGFISYYLNQGFIESDSFQNKAQYYMNFYGRPFGYDDTQDSIGLTVEFVVDTTTLDTLGAGTLLEPFVKFGYLSSAVTAEKDLSSVDFVRPSVANIAQQVTYNMYTTALNLLKAVPGFMIPLGAVRDITLWFRISPTLEAESHISIRPDIDSSTVCENPDGILCTISNMLSTTNGNNDIMDSVVFKYELYMSQRRMILQHTFKVLINRGIVLKSEADSTLGRIALEDQDGRGPSIYEDRLWEKPSGGKRGLTTTYGGSIPFHWKRTGHFDIYVIGTVEKDVDASLGVRRRYKFEMPFYVYDFAKAVFDIDIAIHVNDMQLELSSPAGAIAAGSGFCLGTKENCIQNKCHFIKGSFYFGQDSWFAYEKYMLGLFSEISVETLFSVMCDSNWFGFCPDKVSKQKILTNITNLPPLIKESGIRPLTPPCVNGTNESVNQPTCCTRAEINDPGRGYLQSKNCFVKFSYAPADKFTINQLGTNIDIEKGIAIIGGFRLLGMGGNVYFKTEKKISGKNQVDLRIALDPFILTDINNRPIVKLTQSPTNVTNGLSIRLTALLEVPFTLKAELDGYLSIPFLSIGTQVSGFLTKTQVSLNANITLFDMMSSSLSYVMYNPVAAKKNTVNVVVDLAGFNQIMSKASDFLNEGLNASKKNVTDSYKIAKYYIGNLSSSILCYDMFGTTSNLKATLGDDISNAMENDPLIVGPVFEDIGKWLLTGCSALLGPTYDILKTVLGTILTNLHTYILHTMECMQQLANVNIIEINKLTLSGETVPGVPIPTSVSAHFIGKLFNSTIDSTISIDISNKENFVETLVTMLDKSTGVNPFKIFSDKMIEIGGGVVDEYLSIGRSIKEMLTYFFNGEMDSAKSKLNSVLDSIVGLTPAFQCGSRRRSLNAFAIVQEIDNIFTGAPKLAPDEACNLFLEPYLKQCEYNCVYRLERGFDKSYCGQCLSDSHCGPSEHCEDYRCKPKGKNGARCTKNNGCESGKCDLWGVCRACYTSSDCDTTYRAICASHDVSPLYNYVGGRTTSFKCEFNECKRRVKRPKRIKKRKCAHDTCCNANGDRACHLENYATSRQPIKNLDVINNAGTCGHAYCWNDGVLCLPWFGNSCPKSEGQKFDISCFWSCCDSEGKDAGYFRSEGVYRNQRIPSGCEGQQPNRTDGPLIDPGQYGEFQLPCDLFMGEITDASNPDDDYCLVDKTYNFEHDFAWKWCYQSEESNQGEQGDAPITCTVGEFYVNGSQPRCATCPARHYQTNDTHKFLSCLRCPDGWEFQSSTEICKKCTTGKYGWHSVSDNHGKCDNCLEGTYQDGMNTNPITCTFCPVGKTYPGVGNVQKSDCQPCLGGHVSEQFNENISAYRQQICIKCRAGTYIVNNTSVKCPGTSYSPMAQIGACNFTATTCPIGSYKTSANLTYCENIMNSEVPLTDLTPYEYRKQNCKRSRVSSGCEWEDDTCTAFTGACESCPPGKYNDEIGKMSVDDCKDCKKGQYGGEEYTGHTFAPRTNLVDCLYCSAGKYNDVLGAWTETSCKVCPTGFKSTWGSENCPFTECLNSNGHVKIGEIGCGQCHSGTYLESTSNDANPVCGPCMAGFYNNENGQPSEPRRNVSFRVPELSIRNYSIPSACKFCPTGFISTWGQKTCEPCPKGKYSNAYSNSPFAVTAFYAFDGLKGENAYCSNCLSGKYNDNQGQSACKTCPSGYFSTSSATEKCLPCQAGRTTSGAGSNNCTVWCPPGTHNDGTFSVCEECTAGRYQNDSGKTHCNYCSLNFGHLWSVDGALSCDYISSTCPTGTYGNATSRACAKCDVGKYNDVIGASTCKSCESGKYNDEMGASTCTECAAGTFEENNTCTNCTATSHSTYGPRTYVMRTTGKCSDDTLSKEETIPSNQCKNAAASIIVAKYWKNYPTLFSKAPLCSNCDKITATVGPKGCFYDNSTINAVRDRLFFNDKNATQDCSDVDICLCAKTPFMYTPYSPTGASTCGYTNTTCPVGTVVDGTNECKSCPKGRYNDQVGSYCVECPGGYYGDETKLSACKACDAGRHQADTGSDNSTDCEMCEAGKYISMAGSYSMICTSCSNRPGEYQDETGANTCKKCPVGRYQDMNVWDAKVTDCKDCPIGSYQDEMSTTVVKSGNAGTTRIVEIGNTACKTCPNGKTNDNSGNHTTCSDCPTGKFGQNGLCEDCPLGRYGNQTGLSVCNECPVYFYQNKTGQTDCTRCPLERYSDVGQETCAYNKDNCPKGTHRSGESYYKGRWDGLSVCVNCEVGKYNNQVGQDTCSQTCATGKTSVEGSSNSSQCTACPAGTAEDTNRCVDCEVGKYSNLTGVWFCEFCEHGRYSNRSGQTSCEECEAGTYSHSGTCLTCENGKGSKSGAVECISCTAGQYRIEGTCFKCTKGTAGSAGCGVCGEGLYADEEGLEKCKHCPHGKASGIGSISESNCTVCPVGTGGYLCKACLPGRYSDGEPPIQCKPCSVGRYSNESGATSNTTCLDCPLGKTTLDNQAVNSSVWCSDCPSGYESIDIFKSLGAYPYNNWEDYCTTCAAGKYSQNGSICKLCPNGFGSSIRGQSCKSCPSGKESTESTDGECRDCAAGKYSNIFEPQYNMSCDSCENGKSSSTGSTFCGDRCPYTESDHLCRDFWWKPKPNLFPPEGLNGPPQISYFCNGDCDQEQCCDSVSPTALESSACYGRTPATCRSENGSGEWMVNYDSTNNSTAACCIQRDHCGHLADGGGTCYLATQTVFFNDYCQYHKCQASDSTACCRDLESLYTNVHGDSSASCSDVETSPHLFDGWTQWLCSDDIWYFYFKIHTAQSSYNLLNCQCAAIDSSFKTTLCNKILEKWNKDVDCN